MAKKNTPHTVKSAQPRSSDGLTKAQQRARRAEEQKAALAARKRKENVRRSLIVGAAVIVLAAIVAVVVVISKHQDSSGGSGAEANQYWLNVGDPKAPHKLVIYEDFLCPHCGHMESESGTKLQAAAKSGKVYISYRPFNLLSADGPYSARAINAMLAVKENSGNEAALKLHNLLYAHQPEEPGPQDDDSDDLISLANETVPKADQDKVADAIKGNKYKSAVESMTAYAFNTAHVQGTPTVYLDGKPFTDQSGSHTDPNFGGDENLADNMVKAVQ